MENIIADHYFDLTYDALEGAASFLVPDYPDTLPRPNGGYSPMEEIIDSIPE